MVLKFQSIRLLLRVCQRTRQRDVVLFIQLREPASPATPERRRKQTIKTKREN